MLVAAVASVAFGAFTAGAGERAAAATITASYESGRAGVIINGYGTRAMGTFRLQDGAEHHLALCVEADAAHSTVSDAYRRVTSSIDDARLDALLWWLDEQASIDDDTAVAASALAWFYAGARRSIGPPVWSDGTRGFAPITPESPEPWDALAPFTMSHPVGLSLPGTQLDAAERRVAELHRTATRLSGRWQLDLTAGAGTADVRLSVDGAPLAGRPIEVAVEPGGGAAITRTLRTDTDGRVSLDVPGAPDGYHLTATTAAPGPHQEWDGTGSVQRMATPTARVVSASASRGPDGGHLVVRKLSTDPTIGVEGAVFDLVDATGAVVATASTDADGIARFVDVDRAAHRGPFTIVETQAPPGLIASPTPVAVERLGLDRSDPAVVTVTNAPATSEVLIRKRLSLDAVGPDDRSGFGFTVRRRGDGTEHRLVTDATGIAGPIDLAVGTYEVCESDVPEWAAGLVDTGCRQIEITLDRIGSRIEVDYLNDVPPPSIDTWVSDPDDGDPTLGVDQGSVVDRVRLDGLVPGTPYRLRGELVDAADGTPTGFVGWVEFTADDPTARLDVVLEHDGLSPGAWVVVEDLYVGEVLVARHADLRDLDQTVTIVTPPTTTTTTIATTTTTTTTAVPATSTVATSTTTSTTVRATTSTVAARPPSTLPPTGSDALGSALRLGDLGFVLGVGLFAIAGLAPARHRPGRDEAGR